jgi:hypothetical protein
VSTVGGTPSSPGCGGADAWISFTLAQNELVYVDTFGSSFDTTVGLAAACGSAPSCNNNACSTSQSQVSAILGAGTHYIVVGGSSTGSATVHIQHVPIGTTTATALPASFSVTGNTAGAPGWTTSCGNFYGATPSASFYWNSCPTSPGGTLSASTCGTAWDTVIESFNGDGTAGSCNDDTCGLQSTISGAVPAGAGLHVLVLRGFSATEYGAFTLTGSHP